LLCQHLVVGNFRKVLRGEDFCDFWHLRAPGVGLDDTGGRGGHVL
jgi:hypothetical protein